ncbi:MAG: DUF29 family protein [Alphaproteobacteria bacterium]|nr:DUF29 family protein [Alphaproteobacteria bacterium]MBF0129499.1 DUF29 family protein [Alphaproteobacteria bacterium]
MPASARNEKDFTLWCAERLAELEPDSALASDLPRLAAEIDVMVSRDQRAIEEHLELTLRCLLRRIVHSREDVFLSRIALKRSRQAVSDLLDHGPSLRPHLADMLARQYLLAVRAVTVEARIGEEMCPPHCPWTVEQILDPDFLPVA